MTAVRNAGRFPCLVEYYCALAQQSEIVPAAAYGIF